MAEIWPTLKRKLACDARRKKKKQSSKAIAASSRLEKLAALLKGVHSKSKASSLVERTGASVSAARSLSRSAQEWTASTLARTASRREGSKSPEIVLLQCAVLHTRLSEYSERLSCAEARFNPRAGVEVEQSEAESSDTVCESSVVGSVERHKLGSLCEDGQSQPSGERETAIALPLRRPGRCMKKIRSLQRKSTSAFVVLVALGAFISSRSRKIGNSLAAVLTFNAVVLRVWRRGKLNARFVFSSVALFFLTPLRSYLTYCPRRLSLCQLTDTRTHLSSQNLDSSFVLPLEPSAASVAPLSLLLTIPETTVASLATEPTASRHSSPSRRLVKKVASKFKKLKMFRSSSSSLSRASSSDLASPCTHPTASSEPGSPVSSSAASSPHKCPFSRRLHKSKSDIPSEFGDEESKKSRLSRMSSSEILDIGEITASACSDATPTPTSSSEETVSWPVVGLFVTLLFLVVGRVPAIMATSLFLVVVSNAHHDRAHPRSRRASEAARKLHGNQPPGSPPRRL